MKKLIYDFQLLSKPTSILTYINININIINIIIVDR